MATIVNTLNNVTAAIVIEHAKRVFSYDPLTGVFVWVEPPAQTPFLRGREAGRVSKTTSHYFSRILCFRVDGVRYDFPAHRLAWWLTNGAIPEGMQIDHIDGDALNNRIANLRLVTSAENKRNMAVQARSRTGFHGVHQTRSGKYVAIGRCGPGRHLGTFETIELAVLARKKWEAANGYHKNHGRPIRR